MANIRIGEVLTVGDEKVYLVLDYVGETTEGRPFRDVPVQVEEGDSRKNPIWISEKAISDVRIDHPEARIHGFWSVVLASGKRLKKGYLIHPTSGRDTAQDPGRVSGMYLYFEDGRAIRSGSISHGKDVVASYRSVDKYPVEILDLPDNKIRLPSAQAQTRGEVSERYVQERRALYRKLFVTFALGFVLPWSGSLYLDWETNQAQEQAVAVQNQIRTIEQRITEAERGRFDLDKARFPSAFRSMLIATQHFDAMTVHPMDPRSGQWSGVVEVDYPTRVEGFEFAPIGEKEWEIRYVGE